MSLTEIEIVRDEAGGKAYPWSVRKVVAPVYGPAPPPWATAADVEQAIRILRPQLSLVPEGVEVKITIVPVERPPSIVWKVREIRYFGKVRETVSFVEATSKAEATEIVYVCAAVESKGLASLSRKSGSVHTSAAYYSITKARSWEIPEENAA